LLRINPYHDQFKRKTGESADGSKSPDAIDTEIADLIKKRKNFHSAISLADLSYNQIDQLKNIATTNRRSLKKFTRIICCCEETARVQGKS